MFQKTASSLLVVLLLGTVLVGQCAACPLIVPQAQNHGCCHRGSRQMPVPQEQPAGRACPVQALAPAAYHQLQFGAAQLLPAPIVAAVVPALPAVPDGAVAEQSPSVHAPPDLYLLNSTLLA